VSRGIDKRYAGLPPGDRIQAASQGTGRRPYCQVTFDGGGQFLQTPFPQRLSEKFHNWVRRGPMVICAVLGRWNQGTRLYAGESGI